MNRCNKHIRVGLLIGKFVKKFLDVVVIWVPWMKALIPLAASLLPTLGGPKKHRHLNGRSSLQARGLKTDKPADGRCNVLLKLGWSDAAITGI